MTAKKIWTIWIVLLAFFLSFPFAFIAEVAADQWGMPRWCQWIFSPGFVIGEKYLVLTFNGGWEALGNFILISFSINMLLYGSVIFMVLQRLSRNLDFSQYSPRKGTTWHSGGDNFWTRP